MPLALNNLTGFGGRSNTEHIYLPYRVFASHFDGTNGSTTFTDVHNHTITGSGNAQISTAQSKFGGASLALDGVGDYVSCAPAGEWNMADVDYTIEFWMYPSSGRAGSFIFAIGPDAVDYTHIRLEEDGIGALTLEVITSTNTGNAVDVSSSAGAFSYDTWSHVAIVRQRVSSNDVFTVYVNGVSVISSTVSAYTLYFNTSTYKLFIGTLRSGAVAFNGYIDDVQIFRGVAKYTANFTPPTSTFSDSLPTDPYFSSVVLGLHCDGTNGSTTFTDITGKTITANGNAQISTAQNKFGGSSAYFDGTGDYLAVTGPSLGTSDFTVEGWIYVTTPASGFPIFDSRNADYVETGFTIYVTVTNKQIAYTRGSATITWNTVLSANTWYHIALVRSSSTVTLYINGVPESPTTPETRNFSLTNWRVGHFWNTLTSYSDGYIDDFRITSGVARYTAAFTPPSAPFPNS